MSLTEPGFTCPVCQKTSHNPNDVEHGYCASCREYTGGPMEARTSLRWTGDNADEMAEFAEAHGFRFSLGSMEPNMRWWHRAVNWALGKLDGALEAAGRPWTTWEWLPEDDPSVLEVYEKTRPWEARRRWTIARPGDTVTSDGFVRRGEGWG